jgi:DnaJ family protein C protein 9
MEGMWRQKLFVRIKHKKIKRMTSTGNHREEDSVEEESLYEVLGVEETASSSDIKKAYYKKAREVHPDNQETGDTDLFQKLGRAYEVLSDEKRRKRYDQTGSTDILADNQQDDDGFDWDDYWRALYKKVSDSDISDFAKQYRGSEEEQQDVQKAYIECEGDMDEMLTLIMLSREEDVERFEKWIDQWIKDGKVKLYEKYTSTCKSKKAKQMRKKKLQQAQEEEKEAEQEQKKQKKSKNNKQVALTKPAKRFDDLVNQIQSKYMNKDQRSGSSSSGKKRKRQEESDEISEEDFLKAQQKLLANKKNSTTGAAPPQKKKKRQN